MSYVPSVPVDTSEEAATSMEDHVNRLERMVLRFIRSRGEDGATASEVCAFTGLQWSSGTARIKSLKDQRLIYDCGARRLGPSGRRQRVMVAW